MHRGFDLRAMVEYDYGYETLSILASSRHARAIDSMTTLRSSPYDRAPMIKARHHELGQVNPALLILFVILIISGVWIWKRLSIETQDFIVDQAVPMTLIGLVIALLLWIPINAVRRRRAKSQERTRLLALFERTSDQNRRLDLAFALLENNDYQIDGLDLAIPALKELFTTTLQRALDDKQHRIRGMAASHLGALQDMSVVPLLMKALDDDHAYVRSCAALGLGRLRATDARDRLKTVMEHDWDQTVRSRAREALERMQK